MAARLYCNALFVTHMTRGFINQPLRHPHGTQTVTAAPTAIPLGAGAFICLLPLAAFAARRSAFPLT